MFSFEKFFETKDFSFLERIDALLVFLNYFGYGSIEVLKIKGL